MPADFINPYTFIPLPTEVKRCEPLGHAPSSEQAKSRYVGSFTVTWRLESPMAVPVSEWEEDGAIRVPGSSIKGAVRSVHEALFAGCLRQVDLDFSPTYRDLPSPDAMDGWQMGIVQSQGGAQSPPNLAVRLCQPSEEGLPIPTVLATSLRDIATIPRTGDLITIKELVDVNVIVGSGDNAKERLVRRRARIHTWQRGPAEASAYGAHVGKYLVLITPQGARPDTADWHWAIAPLTDQVRPIGERALDDFGWRSVGAKENETPVDGWIDVKRKGQLLGQRRPQSERLRDGDVVWVRANAEEVTEIKLSQLWRSRSAQSPLRERIPDSTHPCSIKPEQRDQQMHLCLSCSIFGAADTNNSKLRADRAGDGRQWSYGAHVRFGSAVLRGFLGEPQTLAPLSRPHVGSGVAYLKTVPAPPSPGGSDERKSRWDADAPGKPRQLRGRKFYWHSDPEAQQGKLRERTGRPSPLRYLARPNHPADMTHTVLILNRGQEFTQRITFDNLDKLGVQTLLAAFEPERVLDDQGDYMLHLGRGKPLGLGTVKARIGDLHIKTVAARYAGGEEEAEVEFRRVDPGELRRRVGDVGVIHMAARKVLGRGLHEDEWKVSYPTSANWQDYAPPNVARSPFDESYTFFKDHGGPAARVDGQFRWQDGKWRPMPQVSDPHQRWGE